jgi:hypothetical protein
MTDAKPAKCGDHEKSENVYVTSLIRPTDPYLIARQKFWRSSCGIEGGGSSAGFSVSSGWERKDNLAPSAAASLSRAPARASEETDANTSKAHHDAAVPNQI